MSSRAGADVSTSCPARTDPTHAPRLLPTPISGNSRLPCSGGEQIGGKRPELRDHHHVEDADPQEVDDADAQPGADARAGTAAGCAAKNSVTHCTSCIAVDARGERAIGRHEHQQQQRLPRRRIALHFGAALAEDEHLARRLQQVVRRQDRNMISVMSSALAASSRRTSAIGESRRSMSVRPWPPSGAAFGLRVPSVPVSLTLYLGSR